MSFLIIKEWVEKFCSIGSSFYSLKWICIPYRIRLPLVARDSKIETTEIEEIFKLLRFGITEKLKQALKSVFIALRYVLEEVLIKILEML